MQFLPNNLIAPIPQLAEAASLFNLPHVFSITVIIMLIVTLTCVGCSLKNDSIAREAVFRRALGTIGLAIWAFTASWYGGLRPEGFDVQDSLPLHYCDIGGLVASLVLVFHTKILRIVLFFWGIGLSSQGLITPIVEHGPDAVEFYIFWALHALIVGAAFYDLVVHRFIPTFRQAGLAILITFVYGFALLFLNLQLGTNYGYVSKTTPGSTTIIAFLGPWPLRLVWLALIIASGFVLLTGITRLATQSITKQKRS